MSQEYMLILVVLQGIVKCIPYPRIQKRCIDCFHNLYHPGCIYISENRISRYIYSLHKAGIIEKKAHLQIFVFSND